MRNFSDFDLPDRSTAVAMGIFDGIHAGHRAVIEKAVSCAPELMPTVFTFTFAPGEATKTDFAPILTSSLKISLLEKMGVEGILSPRFSDIRALSPEEFFHRFLIGQLRAKMVVCGFDFRFGKNAAGDCALLKQLCAAEGVGFCQVSAMLENGEPISSTRIRAAVRKGDMGEACRLMGRPYAIDHEVVHGRHLGHDVFGFPTINQIYDEDQLLPKFGVYETRIHWNDRTYKGVTNVGVKPTIVGGDKPSAETFILDFNEDVYGQKPVVEFVRFLRGEMKFSSFDALKEQIKRDAEAVGIAQ